MSERIKSLYPSLVGCSIEFRFIKKVPSEISLEGSINSSKSRIAKDVELALSCGGELCVMLLAELTNYYRLQPYYMAVRSAIEMRRYRPAVLDYLQLEVSERSDRIRSVLSGKYCDRNREIKVRIAKYFFGTYPSRLPDFRKFFTREEYFTIA